MRTLVEYRVVLSLAMSAVADGAGLHAYPFPADHVIFALMRLERPGVYAAFCYTYATPWFSMPFLASSIAYSLVQIFVARRDRPPVFLTLPPCPPPEHRKDLFMVLRELHHRPVPTRAAAPSWFAFRKGA